MTDDVTVVVFRRFRNTSIPIALFPYIPAENDPQMCMSYTSKGGMESATLRLILRRTLTTGPEVYETLQRELEGTRNLRLRIEDHIPSDAMRERIARLA